MADAAPLITGQQFDHTLVLGDDRFGLLAASKLEKQRCWLGLCQARQQGAVQLNVQVSDMIGLAGTDRIHAPSPGLQEWGLGGEGDCQFAQRTPRLINNCQFVQRGDSVLEVGEIELLNDSDLQANSRHRRD